MIQDIFLPFIYTLTSWKLCELVVVLEVFSGRFESPERTLDRLSTNCDANSNASLPSPRYNRTYSLTSYGDSISRRKPTNVGTETKREY